MTYAQSLLLCQRRRPVVDPIPSFCDQLRRYEKECREWGHLTAVDDIHSVKNHLSEEDSDTVGCGNVKAGSPSREKRKADSCEDESGSDRIETKKSKMVGPMRPYIGPAKPSAGSITDSSVRKLTPSSIELTKPLIGHARVSTSIGPTKPNESSPNVTNKTSNKSSSEVSQNPTKKKVIGPSMPPAS